MAEISDHSCVIFHTDFGTRILDFERSPEMMTLIKNCSHLVSIVAGIGLTQT